MVSIYMVCYEECMYVYHMAILGYIFFNVLLLVFYFNLIIFAIPDNVLNF